jgi:diguanylate cyclase (GGDEF)-like protein
MSNDLDLRRAVELAAAAGAEVASSADLSAALDRICEAVEALGWSHAAVSTEAVEAGPGETAVPIEAGAERLGTLVAGGAADLPERDAVLRMFAGQAAAAIRLSCMRSQFAAQGNTDEATGLLNRRGFEEAVRREAERAYRMSQPLAAVVVDVDHFDDLLAAHGQSAGASVQRLVADLLRKGLRQVDVAARTGGAQFRVLLPGTPTDGARDVAERLRCTVAAAYVPEVGAVTATFGVACLPEHAANGAALLQAADAAVSLGKRRGRNRVTTALSIRRVEGGRP